MSARHESHYPVNETRGTVTSPGISRRDKLAQDIFLAALPSVLDLSRHLIGNIDEVVLNVINRSYIYADAMIERGKR